MTTREKLEAAFKLFDKDGCGKITAVELKEVFMSLGTKLEAAVIEDIIKQIDVNSDGDISFDEFVEMMSCVHHSC